MSAEQWDGWAVALRIWAVIVIGSAVIVLKDRWPTWTEVAVWYALSLVTVLVIWYGAHRHREE